MRLTILSENYALKAPMAEWGFSVFIETENKKYLFDTGQSGDVVIQNAKSLNIDLTHLDGIILSHGHYDHVGGLVKVLQQCGPTTIFGHPGIFKERYSERNGKLVYTGIEQTKKQLEEDFHVTFKLSSTLTQINSRLWLTGEVPQINPHEKISKHFKAKQEKTIQKDEFPDDNSLIIETNKGLVLLFGCAHRGIVNIMEHAKNSLNKPIYGFVGGTHLHDSSNDHYNFVAQYIKENNINFMAPGHCTGINKIFLLKQSFGQKITPAFCGEVFEL
jgi:7,8-dihydropterin-6-yl-methyl-4-(beta-D-ribofuranosyl)aminobenzene 5'-phosphate synthase